MTEQTLAVSDVTEPAAPERDELTERILDAALVLVARWGVAKTALADVAKEAGCSRATVYRAFPGGKAQLFGALAGREIDAYLQAVLDAIDTAEDLEDGVTRAIVVAARMLADHDAAQFVLEHEPGLLLPFLGFKQVEVLYRYTADAVGPHLERFVPAERARWLTEWASRTFISYLFNPAPDVDLATEAHARALVGRYVMPAFSPDLVR
ncbi:hypothetical protein BH23ACT2_BH23ACT2_01630 [soil metagenome]|jgi:AcrR family transcriptional regulator